MPISHFLHQELLSHAVREPSDASIELHQVTKIYTGSAGTYTALQDITFRAQPGEFVALVGTSGSGKSTFLNLLTGIDRPTTGAVYVAGTPVHTLSQNQLALWRGRTIGIVFQFFQLLPTITVLENVLLPMDFCNTFPGRARKARALHLLEQVGLVEHAHKLPATLSGGEQQRVAIARAQANNPPIIVADEPTGNLDSQTTNAMLHLFGTLVSEGTTLIMVTHERDIAAYATRTVALVDGRITHTAPLAAPQQRLISQEERHA